jgi:hypothetical protein
MAIPDTHGYGCAPRPVTPVNEPARGLVPQGRHAVQQGATQGGLARRGAALQLAGGGDAAPTRPGLGKAGLLPHRTEKPRKRQVTQRGRKRRCHAAIHALRRRVERTLAWEDTCKRWRLRLARLQQRHYGMKVLAYTLINLRACCGV